MPTARPQPIPSPDPIRMSPGPPDRAVATLRPAEGLAFLLAHAFPGHRRLVRGLGTRDLGHLRHALWADDTAERMDVVDRVWRAVTRPVHVPPSSAARLIQLVEVGDHWVYPLAADVGFTRVDPHGGLPADQWVARPGVQVLRLRAE